jgi:hypothetical protein
VRRLQTGGVPSIELAKELDVSIWSLRKSAWSLERTFPADFSRPETQVALQANVVQNNLTIEQLDDHDFPG